MVNRMKSILTELTFSSSRYCHGFYRSLGDCCRFIAYIRCHLASYQVIQVLVTRKYLSQLFEVKKKTMNTWQNKLELEIFKVIINLEEVVCQNGTALIMKVVLQSW